MTANVLTGLKTNDDALLESGLMFNRLLFLCVTCFLAGLGLLMVYSASLNTRPGHLDELFILKHVAFLVFGTIIAMICSQIPIGFYKTLAPFFFAISLLAIILVLIPPFGASINGARRWFRFGALSLQPSEFMKITLPLMLCWVLSRFPILTWSELKASRGWLKVLCAVGGVVIVPVLIVAIEPDLGTAVFLFIGALVLMIMWGWSLRLFLCVGILMIPLLSVGLILKPYQLKRITGYVDTLRDINSAPYQLKQSLITLGSGGIFGTGLGQGIQKKSFLPEANNDFVFAVIGEELGLLVTLSIPVLWILFFVSGQRMLSANASDQFAYNLGFVLLFQIVTQALINTAVVTALVPPKGISHPLLSYGGSNLVVTLLACGLICRCARPGSSVKPILEARRDIEQSHE